MWISSLFKHSFVLFCGVSEERALSSVDVQCNNCIGAYSAWLLPSNFLGLVESCLELDRDSSTALSICPLCFRLMLFQRWWLPIFGPIVPLRALLCRLFRCLRIHPTMAPIGILFCCSPHWVVVAILVTLSQRFDVCWAWFLCLQGMKGLAVS